MKIITLHCDYIKFKALKKAVKDAEELDAKSQTEIKVTECLAVLTAIEKGDSKETLSELIKAIEKTSKEVNANNIVLYPYAHLSSNLASPKIALNLLLDAEKILKKNKSFQIVERAPFGYYKSLELKVKGHPLSELSKEFKSPDSFSQNQIHEEEIDIKELLSKMSRNKVSFKKPPKGLKSNVELGRDLDLYVVNEVVGGGLPLLTPEGATIKREIERFIVDEEIKRGYKHTSTPVLAKSDLYKISGHWQHYKNDMFVMDVRGKKFALRPMTCPFQFILYKRKPRSYKELPIKYAEIASLFRNEQSGELRGLTRLRQFTLADAHIICREDQVEQEFIEALDLIKYVMRKLGIEEHIWYRFSKWDQKNKEKYIQNPKAWNKSQDMMKRILDKIKIKYIEADGEAAFYGPKLDLQYKDVYGKEDTLLTIQVDFALPERYDMTYKDEKNIEQRPMVIHRSSTGATERMISFLLEKTQGLLPLWLSPRQIRVISFTDRNIKEAEKLELQLKEKIPGLKIDSDLRSDTVQGKIRDAELLKINYIIVIGDKEEKSKTLAVRQRGQKPKFGIKFLDFVNDLKKELDN
ncbi:MAG: threonine--tRNA ligase [Candidatus Pacearchaeota archaeon]|nr:threonine--tRNA ligase [Candidatus Pacearchaeota archaeon]